MRGGGTREGTPAQDAASRAVDGDVSAASCAVAEQETAGAPLTWSVDLQAPARVLGAVVHVAKPDAVAGTRASASINYIKC